MLNKEKDQNWLEMMESMSEIRHFSSLIIKKTSKNSLTSSQELDMLFRISLAEEPLSPKELSIKMGIKKTVVSRLIESLSSKNMVEKIPDLKDKRRYTLLATDTGKNEVDTFYYEYLGQLYKLKENFGEKKFNDLLNLLKEANEIMSK